jgi:Leucine-rich repeat (LRR) protein
VWGGKQILLVLAVALGGASTPKETPTSSSWVSDPSDPNNVAIEKAIRLTLKKPEGAITNEDLKQLKYLDLASDKLTDISSLPKSSPFNYITFRSNQITDISPLKHYPTLTRLTLNYNNVSDLSALRNCKLLKRLDADRNDITDLSPISGLTKLESLALKRNRRLVDISPIVGLTNLRSLIIVETKVSDIKFLKNLKKLERLALNDCPNISKEQIDELQKALPNCEILSNPKN